MQRTFILNWDGWIAANLYQDNCESHGINWSQLFIFICWFLWKFIFEADVKVPYKASSTILHYLFEWIAGNSSPASSGTYKTELLCWQNPSSVFFFFFESNMDGSRNAAGLIGAGGVIRDCHGNWCFGFISWKILVRVRFTS